MLPIHLSLLLLSLFSALTAVPLFAVCRRLTSDGAALVAAAFWLTNPWSVWIALTGVEIALAVLLLALAAWRYVRLLERDAPRLADYAGLGLLAGLTLMARTDMVLVLAPVGVGLVVRTVRRVIARARPSDWSLRSAPRWSR